jgi:NAD-dependent dihydropyrimidine dehydrogenase PreA subunit
MRGTAPAASAAGTGISCTTTDFPFLSTAFQPWPAPGSTSSISLGLGSLSGIRGAMVTLPDVAYVIVQPCVGVKDASCVEVCPVDCIHTDDAATMYYIDPDECIDCGACVDPCPVDAIFPEDEVPEQWRDFIKINADYFKK